MNAAMIGEMLSSLLTLENFIFINIGIFIGIVFGAIPGMNGNLAITVFLPFTFQLETVPSLLMLLSIFFGSNFGGSITSILINTPGTGSSAATMLDGYPMCQKGQPHRALDTALMASTFGGVVSALCLLFFAPQLGRVALKFGAPEYFILALFGLSIIATVSGDSISKGLIAAGIGMLLATVGLDKVSGMARFTFGNVMLYNGLKMMAIMLGMFAVAQMLIRLKKSDNRQKTASELKKADEKDKYTRDDFKNTLGVMGKSSLIGAIIGAIPGAGSGIASFLSYNEAKRCAKSGEEFGKGEIKGIAAPESANNGATASSLIPMLTLGIPGSAVAATLMGAFQMHGMAPGPKLFEDSTVLVYALLAGCVIAQFIMLFQGKYLMGLFVKITHVPSSLLTACLMVICCAGAFAIANQSFDVKVMLLCGMIGYCLSFMDFPIVPLVLGLILGPTAEAYLRNSLSIGNGNWLIFFQRPICIGFMVLLVVLIVLMKKRPSGSGKNGKIEETT